MADLWPEVSAIAHLNAHPLVLSPALDRPSCAQTLRLLRGSSRPTSTALDALGRGRSAGRGRGQRPLTCCIHAAATYAHACASWSRDPFPLTVISRLLDAAVASRPRLSRANLEPVISTGSLLSRTRRLGRLSLHRCACSLPRGHWVQPSALCWGSPGWAGFDCIHACTG